MDNEWHPFNNRESFEFANFHFVEAQDSKPNIQSCLDFWAATTLKSGTSPQRKNADELYASIDSIQCGDSPCTPTDQKSLNPLFQPSCSEIFAK
jgi:hypothetical protein